MSLAGFGMDVAGPFTVNKVDPFLAHGYWKQGKVFYLDPESGSDNNGTTLVGATIDKPMQTLLGAYNKLTDESGDKIVLLNDGNTGKSVRLAAALTWAKDNCSLIGVSSMLRWSHRSRITGESTGATFTPLLTVSGHGNTFANFSMFHDYGVDPICMVVTGNRNSFYNCHFGGIGVAAGGDDAAAASVQINGAQETYFERCTFGLDTVPRSTTCAEVEIKSAATRVWFKDCFFNTFADNAGALHVKIDGSGDLDRIAMFEDCVFYNAVESTATAMTSSFDHHNTSGGAVAFRNCLFIGVTDIAAADNGNIYTTDAAPTAGTAGLAVAVTR